MEISTLRENEQFCHSEEINQTPTNLPTPPRNRSVSRSSSNSEEKGLTNQKRRDSTGASGKGSDPVGVRDRRNSLGKRSQASQSGSSIGQGRTTQTVHWSLTPFFSIKWSTRIIPRPCKGSYRPTIRGS